MLGALVGYKALPNDMVMKVVDFDCNQVNNESDLGQIRPNYLNTNKYLLRNIDQMIEWRPTGRLFVNTTNPY